MKSRPSLLALCGSILLTAGLAACGGIPAVDPSDAVISISPSPWSPVNGYTEADYQTYLDVMAVMGTKRLLTDDEKRRYPLMVNCAWGPITQSLPRDAVMAYLQSEGVDDPNGIARQIQVISNSCVLLEEKATASPSS